MTYRTLILIFCLQVINVTGFSQDNSDDRLKSIVKEYGEAEVIVVNPARERIDFILANFSVSSIKNDSVRIRLSTLTIELFINQGYKYIIDERIQARSLRISSGVTDAMQWDSYPSYDQYIQIMNEFASMYPDLCKIDTIGLSINGKLIIALKISDNARTDEDEPEVFYTSTIHGDETGGFILMLHLADYLLKNYPSDSRVKDIVENLEIWINPLANPDGTYKTGNVINSFSSRFNANEVDLNRNFPDPAIPYNSRNNIRQKETTGMIRFLGKHRFVISANFHSGEEVVNYPWDSFISKLHADNDWFYRISRSYADTVHKYSSSSYMNGFDNGVVRGAVWYIINGGRQDYVTGQLQGREVTIELDKDYITPSAELLRLWENNYRSLLEYLGNALYGVHGKVTDAMNFSPLPAKIFISGHDKDSSHVYSDTLSGNYVRMLSAGSYNLTFHSSGYRDSTINVQVSDFERTTLDVSLTPISGAAQKYPVLYPNPAQTRLNAILPADFAGTVNVRIYNIPGALLKNFDALSEIRKPLNIDVSTFASGTYVIVFTNVLNNTLRGRFIVIR
ncbi:MAG TPA: M14 family zinc carboxypeptidase [Bacteroidales bacterium]|nr:M14 family zinc carboxypeptidase [Bacteroidales bacterium]